MKKKARLRGRLGVPLGMAMVYLITIVISLGWGPVSYTHLDVYKRQVEGREDEHRFKESLHIGQQAALEFVMGNKDEKYRISLAMNVAFPYNGCRLVRCGYARASTTVSYTHLRRRT